MGPATFKKIAAQKILGQYLESPPGDFTPCTYYIDKIKTNF